MRDFIIKSLLYRKLRAASTVDKELWYLFRHGYSSQQLKQIEDKSDELSLIDTKPMAHEVIDPYEILRSYYPERKYPPSQQEIEEIEKRKKKLSESYRPKTRSEVGYEEATKYAQSVQPSFPRWPGDIAITIPKTFDVKNNQWVQMYPTNVIKEESDVILRELEKDIHASPSFHDHWEEREAFHKHPFFSFRNALRHALPGFFYGFVAFIAYVLGEYVYGQWKRRKHRLEKQLKLKEKGILNILH